MPEDDVLCSGRYGVDADDGIDAAHKLAILASLAFGRQVDFDNIYVEGIRHISKTDIYLAEELALLFASVKLLMKKIIRLTLSCLVTKFYMHKCLMELQKD